MKELWIQLKSIGLHNLCISHSDSIQKTEREARNECAHNAGKIEYDATAGNCSDKLITLAGVESKHLSDGFVKGDPQPVVS